MSYWSAAVPIFDDEDEEALIAEYVELRAKYPHRLPYEISQYVFRNLHDPVMRAGQAAQQWEADLDIAERIDAARRQGNDPNIATKEAKLKALEEIFNAKDTPIKQKIEAIKLHSEIQGEIVKPVEKRTLDLTPRFPQIIATVYPDD